MPTVRLFVAEADGRVFVETPDSLAKAKVTDADLEEGFGKAGQWWTVELNTPSFGLQEEAKRLAQVPDEAVGFRLDLGLLTEARANLMITKWPEWRWPTFAALPPNLANVLDQEIQVSMYPAAASHAGFFEVLRRKRQSSQAGTKEPPQKADNPE